MKNNYLRPTIRVVHVRFNSMLMVSGVQDNPANDVTVGSTVTNASLFETKSQGNYNVWGDEWNKTDVNK